MQHAPERHNHHHKVGMDDDDDDDCLMIEHALDRLDHNHDSWLNSVLTTNYLMINILFKITTMINFLDDDDDFKEDDDISSCRIMQHKDRLCVHR